MAQLDIWHLENNIGTLTKMHGHIQRTISKFNSNENWIFFYKIFKY